MTRHRAVVCTDTHIARSLLEFGLLCDAGGVNEKQKSSDTEDTEEYIKKSFDTKDTKDTKEICLKPRPSK